VRVTASNNRRRQVDYFKNIIEESGLIIKKMRENTVCEFLSKSARNAGKDFGVKSVTVLAVKPLK